MTEPERADENSFLWLASDLPDPTHYAEALFITRPDLARELRAAHKTRDGWKFCRDPDYSLICELRALGLAVTASGESSTQAHHSGWHVSHFGLVVRNRLLEIVKLQVMARHSLAVTLGEERDA